MTAREFNRQRALVDAAWLSAHLDDDNLFVFDATTTVGVANDGQDVIVPERERFLAGHIPGAQFLDIQGQLSDVGSPYKFMQPSREYLQAALRDVGIRHDSKIVVYSTTNFWWAARVWWLLRQHGVEQVYVLDGGFAYWSRQGLPVETEEAKQYLPGDITLSESRESTVTGDQILAGLAENHRLLVNALPKDKFTGKSAHASGRRGHIPGSINVPAASFVDASTGLLYGEEILVDVLQPLLSEDARDVVAYCGGGVSATAIIFVLFLFGVDHVRLYDASLAEWANDVRFPLVTGE